MLDNLTLKQKIIVITIGIVVLIGIVYYIYNNTNVENNFNEEEILVSTEEENNNNEEKKEENEVIIVIHITGGVKIPGIVKLPEGARVEDAIEKAGGLTEDADISKINLAYILEDGMKITIPKSSDVEGISEKEIISNEIGQDIIDKKQETTSKNININKANEDELSNLPGIGPSLALKIISYREENGKFKNIEDIKNVNGIGESKFENIKNIITVK